MLLGCIGDDFTGSSDLANTLAKGGMRTVQYTRIPDGDAPPEIEAAVISLKSRTCPPAEAVAMSLAALEWLERQGCRQFFFKYCSTFDSMPDGNIGPVAEALADRLGLDRAIVCPAFPAAGRTLYNGHLFVGDRLLSQSGMERHPLTPMSDPDIRRWLARQSSRPVGHVAYAVVAEGAEAIHAALDAQAREGRQLIVVDAIRDADLMAIGAASADLRLVTGGSGVALGLPANFRKAGLLAETGFCAWAATSGPAAILSGSCSAATRHQIARHRAAGEPSFAIDADEVMAGTLTPDSLAAWFSGHESAVPLAYSSAEPEAVAEIQARYGKDKAAAGLDAFFAETAKQLVRQGVTRLIVAGGETSGAVVGAMARDVLEIGPEIDPGVPIVKVGGTRLSLALKSGNFGGRDFFMKAAGMMAR
jgi:3-dehydrotetronate 4-kinase